MYAYYHEHFEISNFDSTIRVTCTCGKDFIWTAKESVQQYHRCPHCSEPWVIGQVGGYITLLRKKTGAKIKLWIGEISNACQGDPFLNVPK
ncbi:MAG: hypothetical protein A4E56_00187 [Pelotomaculum sp. PtaU1.Bin065]|nr:MAG: hypothetical protein A4E56_00187 [Pelotomaculum sp. PtaU1.Bin065]